MKTNVTKLLSIEVALNLATTDKIGIKDKYLKEEKKFKTNQNF